MNIANADRSERPRAPKPPSIHVEPNFDSLNITYRWWSGKFLFLLLFCIAWDSFLIFWYSMVSMVSQGTPLDYDCISNRTCACGAWVNILHHCWFH
jgi:hypothetical protein